jgi:hypothetical protein
VGPVAPVGPVGPCGPVPPVGPGEPVGPFEPDGPGGPGVVLAAPVAPATPAGPVDPGGPGGPLSLARTNPVKSLNQILASAVFNIISPVLIAAITVELGVTPATLLLRNLIFTAISVLRSRQQEIYGYRWLLA